VGICGGWRRDTDNSDLDVFFKIVVGVARGPLVEWRPAVRFMCADGT
jgi:hypothetical protein